MPKTFDDLFEAVVADVSTRTQAPGALDAITSSRRRSVSVAVASLAVIAVLVAGVFSLTLLMGGSSKVEPAPEPPPFGLDVGDVPVWYDEDGLHRGDVVEQTAIPLSYGNGAALSLVRTGALYQDSKSGEIWFHPWGGEPRIIGTDSEDLPLQGAVGDPEGDNAAWFEGAELVVYDTAAGREIVRVSATRTVDNLHAEHAWNSNGFLQVSSDVVVWTSGEYKVRRLDLQTLEFSELPSSTMAEAREDVYGQTELWSWTDPDPQVRASGMAIRAPDSEEVRSDAFREGIGSFSPDGRFVLGVTSRPHGSGFVDIASGEFFALPDVDDDFYAVNAWSYGNTALIVADWDSNRGGGGTSLLACYPERRTCDTLPREGSVVLPWS